MVDCRAHLVMRWYYRAPLHPFRTICVYYLNWVQFHAFHPTYVHFYTIIGRIFIIYYLHVLPFYLYSATGVSINNNNNNRNNNTYIHTHIYTYIHLYIYTCIHIYIGPHWFNVYNVFFWVVI